MNRHADICSKKFIPKAIAGPFLHYERSHVFYQLFQKLLPFNFSKNKINDLEIHLSTVQSSATFPSKSLGDKPFWLDILEKELINGSLSVTADGVGNGTLRHICLAFAELHRWSSCQLNLELRENLSSKMKTCLLRLAVTKHLWASNYCTSTSVNTSRTFQTRF